jgi:guanylate kinase
MQRGRVILLSGPSGSGKGSLMAFVREAHPEFVFPTTWTTRAPRPGELDGTSGSGKKYKFVSVEEFKEAIDRNQFLEWDHHFDNYYGTPLPEVETALKEGKTVFQELDVLGATHIRERLSHERVVSIFLTVGSVEDLERRIRERQPDISAEELAVRKDRYLKELQYKDNAEYILANEYGKLTDTQAEFARVLAEILQ